MDENQIIQLRHGWTISDETTKFKFSPLPIYSIPLPPFSSPPILTLFSTRMSVSSLFLGSNSERFGVCFSHVL